VAEEVNAAFGIDAKLSQVPFPSGIFDVYVNGDLLFSKSEEGRLPANGEIAALIKERKLNTDSDPSTSLKSSE